MIALSAAQAELRERVRASPLRADSAHALVDLAVATRRHGAQGAGGSRPSYGRANKLVSQLVELEIPDVVDPSAYKRRFFAPRVLRVLTSRATS